MDLKEQKVEFSPIESKILNLKIGRVASDEINVAALRAEILQGEYDLCRLKISAEIEEAVLQMDELGFPYHFSASIRRYKTPIKALTERPFLHPDIEYIKFDESRNDLLKSMLIDCWGKYPIGYYRTPFLTDIIEKEKEILCVYDYYKEHNLQKNHPNNTIMFMKHKGEFVGFFALNIIDNRLESHIGGILAPYREGGYFFDMQEYIRRFCLDNDLKYFCFGARNENSRVQAIFEKFGYQGKETENVFHIPALLSSSKEEKVFTELDIKDTTFSAVDSQLLICFNLIGTDDFLPNFSQQSFNTQIITELKPGMHKIQLSFPLVNKKLLIGIVKMYNDANELVCFGRLERRV